MSLEGIGGLVREMIKVDDALTDPKTCRGSMLKIAGEIKKGFPDAGVSFLAYPEACEEEGVHYAILVVYENCGMIINTVKSPGFPLYIGSLDLAVPTFSAMKRSDIVK